MSNPSCRVVLDTNQVVGAGTRWLDHGVPAPDSNAHCRLLICVAESHTALHCGKVVGGYLEKLVDLGYSPGRALRLMTYLMGAFSHVIITTNSAPFPSSDPDDEILLICALDGKADYLVSEDRVLTSLRSRYSQPVIGTSAEHGLLLGA